MSEQWKPVLGWCDLYEVSDHGNVKSLRSDKLLSRCTIKAGYLVVALCRNGVPQKHLVHRLVAAAFIGPAAADGMCVNHIDGNKKNNNACNLEYATRRENTQHASTLPSWPRGSQKVEAKLTEEKVIDIRRQGAQVSQRELAQRYGVDQSTISLILSGHTWKHVPMEVSRA